MTFSSMSTSLLSINYYQHAPTSSVTYEYPLTNVNISENFHMLQQP